jgi:hypothetical protein
MSDAERLEVNYASYSPPATRSGQVTRSGAKRRKNKSKANSVSASKKSLSETWAQQSANMQNVSEKDMNVTPGQQQTLENYVSVTKVSVDANNVDITQQKPGKANKANKDLLKEVYEKISKVENHQKLLDEKIEKLLNFSEKLSEIRAEVHDLNIEMQKCKQDCTDLQERIDLQAIDINNLSIENRKLRDQNDQLEQYGRRNNIRILGVPEDKILQTEGVTKKDSEDTLGKVINLVQNKLGLTAINGGHVDIAHRIGPRLGQTEEASPRPIIVKFISRRHKIEVLANRKKLKGQKMVIVEDLTKANQTLWKATAQNNDVQSAWTIDGTVHALLKSNRFVRVRRHDDVGRLDQLVPYKTKKTA